MQRAARLSAASLWLNKWAVASKPATALGMKITLSFCLTLLLMRCATSSVPQTDIRITAGSADAFLRTQCYGSSDFRDSDDPAVTHPAGLRQPCGCRCSVNRVGIIVVLVLVTVACASNHTRPKRQTSCGPALTDDQILKAAQRWLSAVAPGESLKKCSDCD